MNIKLLILERNILTTFTCINLVFGLMYIFMDLRNKPNKYILLGVVDYFLIQVPICTVIIASFAEFYGVIILLFIQMIVGFSVIPFTLLIWVYMFTRIFHERSTIIVIPTVILVLLFEGCFWYFLFVDISMLGVSEVSFHLIYGPVLIIFLLVYLAYYAITGFIFVKKTDLDKDNTDILTTGDLIAVNNLLAIPCYLLFSVFLLPNAVMLFFIYLFFSINYLTYHGALLSIKKGTYKGW